MDDRDRQGEFSAAELNVLEDSLADLDHLPEDATAAVIERLASYRAVLDLTREGMPTLEVPEGILDAVLAEAERSPAVNAEVTAGPSLWERLRRSFVLPGFALAATAAILVITLRPDDDLAKMSEEADVSATPASAENAELDPEGAPVEARPASTSPKPADVLPAAPPSEEKAKDEVAAEDADDEADASRKPTAKKSAAPAKSKSKKDAGIPGALDLPAPAAEDPVDSGDKAALRDLLAQADNDRRRGRCAEAKAAYKNILGSAGAEEARALVGLGLCAESAGDEALAESYFRKARTLNPAIDSLIASERSMMSAPSSKKASKASKLPTFE